MSLSEQIRCFRHLMIMNVIAKSQNAFFEFVVMLVVPHLVATELRELNAILGLFYLKNSDANFSL